MNEKVAVVTGSSSGIGLVTAVELARHRYHVVASMRDLNRRGGLDQAAAAAQVMQHIEVRRLDVTEFPALPLIIKDILRDHGRIDVLVNNAGFAVAGFAEDIRLEEVRQQLETNFFGQVAMTQAVLPAVRAQRSGHIIMLSSIGGRMGQPGLSSYCASKFALEGWSEALRIELWPLGIRVVLVEPGSYQTDIWERNVRIGQSVLSPDSPNYQKALRFAQLVRDLPKGNPTDVARLIARVAGNPNPKLRYTVGLRAHLQRWFHGLTPWKWYEKIVLKALQLD